MTACWPERRCQNKKLRILGAPIQHPTRDHPSKKYTAPRRDGNGANNRSKKNDFPYSEARTLVGRTGDTM